MNGTVLTELNGRSRPVLSVWGSSHDTSGCGFQYGAIPREWRRQGIIDGGRDASFQGNHRCALQKDGLTGAGPTRSATACSMEREHTLRQRSYWTLIFSSFSRLALMDSSTELVPLIHSPPSRRVWRISSDREPKSKISATTVASSPSGVRM